MARSAPFENSGRTHLSSSALSRGTCQPAARSAVSTRLLGVSASQSCTKCVTFRAATAALYLRLMADAMSTLSKRALKPSGPTISKARSESTRDGCTSTAQHSKRRQGLSDEGRRLHLPSRSSAVPLGARLSLSSRHQGQGRFWSQFLFFFLGNGCAANDNSSTTVTAVFRLTKAL